MRVFRVQVKFMSKIESLSLSLFDRVHRRLAPRQFKRSQQQRVIDMALRTWGGASPPADHALWREAMFKQTSGSHESVQVRFATHPDVPILVRLGTADPNPFRQVFLEAQYADLRTLLPDALTILDVGANIGYTALWFAMHFPDAAICAVEPLADNIERIRLQLDGARLNHRVQVIAAAADIRAGSADFYTYEDGFFHTSGSLIADAQHRARAAAVECVTLPDLIARAGWAKADIIKIDIEGAETRLLTDGAALMRPLLETTRAFALELHSPEAETAARTLFDGWRAVRRGEITCFTR
jgi:FkbM family methyltransferase